VPPRVKLGGFIFGGTVTPGRVKSEQHALSWLTDVLSLSETFPAERCELRGCSQPGPRPGARAGEESPGWGAVGAGSPPPVRPHPLLPGP